MIRKISGSLKEQTRGLINPLLIRATPPYRYCVEDALVIAGFPRSGTTWLAEVFSTLPRTAVLFEPLDYRSIPAAKRAGLSWDNFRTPNEYWPEGQVYFENVLTGKVLTNWTTSHIPLRRALAISRWIVKFVRANLLLGWLVEHFAIRPPVLIIRHPCAVFSSWVSRGWPLVDYPLPEGLRFFRHYPQHKEWIRALGKPEEIFAAQWGIQHRTVIDHMRSRVYYLCTYENMIRNGAAEVRSVFDHWGLSEPAEIESALLNPSAKASASLESNAARQLEAWRKKVDSPVVERMLAVLRRLELDFYSSDPEPDYQALSQIVGRQVNQRS